MKKLAILLVLAMVATFAHAQDDYNNDQIQTIFSKRKSNGGYGAFTIGYSQIDGKDALITGGRGAFIFDHSFAIGFAGYGFVNNLDYHSFLENQPRDFTLAGGYGGIFIEPIIEGKRPVHLSFPILFGMGGAALVENYDIYNTNHFDPFYDLDHDIFFVVEPAVELEFNLARFFRTAASVSYRYTSKIDLQGTSEDVLRGLNFGLTFKFGKF